MVNREARNSSAFRQNQRAKFLERAKGSQKTGRKTGAAGENRTLDLTITNGALYH